MAGGSPACCYASPQPWPLAETRTPSLSDDPHPGELVPLKTELVFSRKLREGVLTPRGYEVLIDQFKIDCEDGLWTWLPATDDPSWPLHRR